MSSCQKPTMMMIPSRSSCGGDGRYYRGGSRSRSSSRRRSLSAFSSLSSSLALCITAAILVLSTTMITNANAQDGLPSLQKTGPKPCKTDSSVLGYDNTTALTVDMLLKHDEIVTALLEAGVVDPTYDKLLKFIEGREFVFKLCPNTVFDLGDIYPASVKGGESDEQTVMPIVPFVPNSVIQCGNDGSMVDKCVIKGGLFQLVVEDDHVVTNVTFVGLTFEDSRLVSVAAYGHQLNDGSFVNCVWKDSMATPILVDLAYDPNLFFGIIERPADRNRRMTVLDDPFSSSSSLSQVAVSKIGMIRTKFRVDWETSSAVVNRSKGREYRRSRRRWLESDEVYPGMLAGFFGCTFENLRFGFGVLNEGGRVELYDVEFVNNQGISCVVVTKGGKIAMHGGTTFSENKDMFGPVFLDSESQIVLNKDVTGEGNAAMDTKGVPIQDSCPAIFKEESTESNCLAGELCRGKCCDFGMPDCFKEKTANDDAIADSALSEVNREGRRGGGGRGGCDTTCVVVATVVPICTLSLILFGVWYARRNSRGARSSFVPSASAPPPPTMEQIGTGYVPRNDLEHHMA